MILELKCGIHCDEDITRINLSQSDQKINRVLCGDCLDSIQNMKSCQIKKVPDLIKKHGVNVIQDIQEEQAPYITKYKKVIKLLNTLKDKTIKMSNELEIKLEEQLAKMETIVQAESMHYNDLLTDITRSKLQDIAEMLSGNDIRKSILPDYGMDQMNSMIELTKQFQQLIQSQSKILNEINEIYIGKISLRNKYQFEEACWALTCNQKMNIIASGRGNDIVIWKQNELNMIETSVLKGHQDCITILVSYQQGDVLISGGGSDDKQIKVWQNNDEQWTCIQTILDHNGRINDIKLTQNEKQLISASDDKVIKVWKQLSNLKLECIQTLDEHNRDIYWISISFDNLFMASSIDENYFNIYVSELTDINPWKKLQAIQTQGKIHRTYFTNTNYLMVQQVNPPKLIIYQQNSTNLYEKSQVISLNEPNNNDILFPIFQFGNSIIVKNSKNIYLIKKRRSGQFFVEQTIQGDFSTGCTDINREYLILSNSDNGFIEFYK